MVDKCLAEDTDEQEPSCADDTCCVCLSRVATVHAYPCGHKISCRLCATIMLKVDLFSVALLNFSVSYLLQYCPESFT
ncbi:unnamed protein product [Nippostrongylus brasiliensis]|uniref:Zf-C3HC4 domain-containing protein n=1 Tax=Nippostrongylus brasiliensis TaxID=27835 RepID=A0A0N4YKK7_NIPBR|nr:unnamed protein product [Nippostrongylus brasiliensis]